MKTMIMKGGSWNIMYSKVKRIIKRKLIKLKECLRLDPENKTFGKYRKKFYKYTFIVDDCESYEQYEASITRVYHTIEKGLSYVNYRAGFGKNNINILLKLMENYAKKYDTTAFFYETALSVLNAYTEKNATYNHIDRELNQRIAKLPGHANDKGGIVQFTPLTAERMKTVNYENMVVERHSIRSFSDEPVPVERLLEALCLAQYTPSACNRQGWKTRIVADKEIVMKVLKNQNGNNGFTEQIDKVLVVTADLRYFNRDREIHQAFIDGGMYAMRVLDSLNYKGIATIPLSASLREDQERNIREYLKIHDAEEFILIIGVGNYPTQCQTTRSERKPPDVTIF